jgi:hypothetical protein
MINFNEGNIKIIYYFKRQYIFFHCNYNIISVEKRNHINHIRNYGVSTIIDSCPIAEL